MPTVRAFCAGALAIGALAAAGCRSDSSEDLTLLAASSLTEVADDLAESFEAATGVSVQVELGASDALARQVAAGNPADVLLTADVAAMEFALDELRSEPEIVARNELTIAATEATDAGVGPEALADDSRVVVVCDPSVPCGVAAEQLFETTRITPSIDSYEANVRAVLTRIETGEADLGLVYRTDVLAREGRVFEAPLDDPPQVDVAAAVVSDDPAARTFVEYLAAADGQAAFAARGFLGP